MAEMYVAERCRDESALQRQDSPSLGPWDACPSKNPFAQFHISPNCKDREFLTEEELKAVATLALSKGMPIESVSRVLGHTNIVTTQIYAKITSQKLDNDLTMLGNKLNASFKNLKMA